MPRVIPEYREIARGKIIEAARGVFLEKGFRQASMEEIANRLGISKAALYTYFEDKEDLFKAAYESSPAALEDILKQVPALGGPRKSFEFLFDKLQPSPRSSALGFEVMSEATRNLGLKKVLKSNYEQYVAAVERCMISAGVEKGSKTHEMAKGLVALWNGMETLMVIGYPVSEVQDSWKEILRRIFPT